MFFFHHYKCGQLFASVYNVIRLKINNRVFIIIVKYYLLYLSPVNRSMKNLIYYLLLIYAFICAVSIYAFNGTGDSGDSISHFLFTKYAPVHPRLFFDHWAKPLFVLLASPFAQFGFIGIKVFNSLVSIAVLFFTYKTTGRLNIANPILAAVILMFSPLNYILTFSGLTEPLFALFTILGIYFCADKKFISAAILISFLPYIRSEGLIILGVFGLYFLYRKSWKVLPFLFFGSVAYGIAGYFVHGNLLWVFTKIPYARLSSVYGHGRLLHFIDQLVNVTGVPIYILFWVGFIGLIVLVFRKKFNAEQHILLFLGFLTFFAAHSLFWYLGIFNSMGLKRVLIGILPIIALITLLGFNFITETLWSLKPTIKKTVQALLVGYILIFPFTVNPSAIQWEKDMMLSPDQKLAEEVAKFVLAHKKTKGPLLYNYRYLSLSLNMDYFDPKVCKQISKGTIEEMAKGDFLIWDNQYANFESGLEKENLDSLSQLTTMSTYKINENGKECVFVLYEKK